MVESNGDGLTGFEVAVIGMAGRFPGASHIDEFWENLKNGIETISFFNEEEAAAAGIDAQTLENPNYVRARGELENSQLFDAFFFGYTPAEAEIMDPQIRIFHQCIWHALEDAGCDPDSYKGLIGLYAGAADQSRWQVMTLLNGAGKGNVDSLSSTILANKDYLCTRISYNLNLKGPSTTLINACSTSLVATHLAYHALLSGQCDIALAGGISLAAFKRTGYTYQQGMMVSPDGHNRTFDAKARGTMFGNGAVVVVLKRLGEAVENGDHIYAVIKGTAINNDGGRKVGFTAPSVEGQAEVIKHAMQMAEVDPETVTYIETHGTATSIGDTIEFEALKKAFNTQKRGFCRIGSVKTNVGHLDTAAGVTGLIKTALALKHRLIPPSLHFETPNPGIDLDNSPFCVNRELTPWQQGKYPRRAGVSAFGIGGTNVHIILEEPPAVSKSVNQWVSESVGQLVNGQPTDGRGGSLCPPLKPQEHQLILLSAKTESALNKMMENLSTYLKENPDINFADMAYTLQARRKAFTYRKMLIASSVDETRHTLLKSKQLSSMSKNENREIVFMFPGLGAQYVNMGRELYETVPFFRQETDRCFEILKPLLDYDIKEILYPDEMHNRSHRSNKSYIPDMNQIEIAQPLVFIFEYCLAKLLMHWGIKPHALIGYSFGEYTAACLSGVLSPEDALKLIVTRGHLIGRQPAGIMLSVPAPVAQVEPLLTGELSIAIDNGSSSIVSGPYAQMEEFEARMKNKRYLCMRLNAFHALHSSMMEPVLEKFKAAVDTLSLNEPKIPYISNVTGNWITVAQARDPAYWANHLRETVRFADGIKQLVEEPDCLFIEIGPGRDLLALIQRYIGENSSHKGIDLIPVREREVSDMYYLLHRIGQLWLYGIKINWAAFYEGEPRRCIPLPLYPFEGQHYGNESKNVNFDGPTAMTLSTKTLFKKPDIANWFYIPQWSRSTLSSGPGGKNPEPSITVFFTNQGSLASRLVNQLRQQGVVITVEISSTFKKHDDLEYAINPRHWQDYPKLVTELAQSGRFPGKIIHFWNVTGNEGEVHSNEMKWEETIQYVGFFSLIYLVRAIGIRHVRQDIQIDIVSDNLQEVTGAEELCPFKAAFLGLVRVIPQEYPNIRCRSIDIKPPAPGSSEAQELIRQLCREFAAIPAANIVAFRNNYRWVQFYEPIPWRNSFTDIPKIKRKGVYLVTGGLGNIGFSLAEYLAEHAGAKLILTGRTKLPPEEKWEQWLADHESHDPISSKIKRIKTLQDKGGEVLTFSVDVGDQQGMRRMLNQAEEKLGPINGVIHAAGQVKAIINPIQNFDREHCNTQFKPKIHGVLTLAALLKDKEIDFCILISSLSPILGGLGFASYSAANAFMDAFVYKHNRTNPGKWISVNWGDWKFLKQNPPDQEKKTGIKTTISHLEMTPDEGKQTFQRILFYCQSPQVVVSAGDLDIRLKQWVKLESMQEEDNDMNKPSFPHHSRPDLLNPYAAPRNRTEQAIVDIWRRLFGLDRVGIQDDFFDLGGDSLKAVTVISKMHKKLNVLLSLVEFFQRPNIEKLAQYISNTKEIAYSSINPVEKREYYGLSSAQKRLFIIQQIEKSIIAYNEPQALAPREGLSGDRVEKIFKKLIQRHESLRTSFEMIHGEPVQKIHDINDVKFTIEYYDLQVTGAGDRCRWEQEGSIPVASKIKDFIRPFDLSQMPLLRVGLIRLPGIDPASFTGEHMPPLILIVDLHHIITDGTSNQLLVNELITLYQEETLPQLKIHYKDYALWLNNEHRQLIRNKQEKYWLDAFPGELPILDLPTDYLRPAQQSFEGKTIGFQIGLEESQALKDLLPEEDTTLFMKLLAIFYVFLFKLTGQEDIIVGSPTAGRRHSDLEQMIGMFVNTLAIRNYPKGNQTFSQFLREVKARVLSDFEHQEYPFEDLIDRLDVSRDMSRNPIFDVAFVLQNLAVERTGKTANKPTIVPYRYQHRISKFDLSWQGFVGGERLSFRIEYCIKLFKDETIKRYIGYLERMITSVINSPHQRLREIDLVSQEEKNLLLFDFNDTGNEYPKDKTIHQLFREQVKRTPDQITVVGPPGMKYRTYMTYMTYISYRELNEKSNQLAHILQEKGVRTDTIVAIMAERSVEMIIGLLAILKAGAAYLPIDPGYPERRIKYMLKDSVSEILMTTRDYSKEIKFDKEIIYISDAINRVPTPSTSTLTSTCQVGSANLAYIIYTSGTTGRPKGVLVGHRGFVNLIYYHQETFGQQRGTRMSQVASQGFDAMAFEVWPCLAWGAALFIAANEIRLEPVKIKNWLIKNKINISFQPTVMAQQLLTLQWPEQGVELKALLTAGDRLKQHPARKFPFQLYNLYGPTEDTVWSTWTKVEVKGSSGKDIHQYPTIGKPIGNHRVYIFNPNWDLQPIGVPGELCISGDGLARGYLNQPELTAEKFCLRRPGGALFVKTAPPGPPRKNFLLEGTVSENNQKLLQGVQGDGFLEKSPPGRRRQTIYRTGDLARWLPGGNIDFLGRIDNQVKIRGFRIEMGEIESLLLKHSQIKDVAVLAGEKGNNDQYLCAYFAAESQLPTSKLKTHLARQLPDYMIPAYFMQLDKIPMTPNGKVDRRALPEPGIQSNEDDIKPNTEIEKLIAGTWKEVLGIDKIGVHTPFFDIGGNSLNILQVQSKLKDAIKIDVPLMVIFKYPTIYSLAGYISSERSEENNTEFLSTEQLDLDKNMMKQSLKKLGANVYRQPPAEGLEDQPIKSMESEHKEKE